MKKTVLNNGLTIITEERFYSKMVSFGYSVKAGSYQEKNYPYGTAHFVEHMLFKGTKNRTFQQINNEIANVGGDLNAYTTFDETKYECSIVSEHWKSGLEILSDLFWNPTLPIQEIKKERNVIIEEIKEKYDDPEEIAIEALIQTLFVTYPERHSVLGTIKSVQSIKREHLINFIEEFYTTNNTVLVVTGNVKHEEVVSFIESYSISRLNGTALITEKFTYPSLKSQTITQYKDIQQSHLVWGMFSPSATDKDVYIMDVIINLLSGYMGSRLIHKIREEKGLIYSIMLSEQLSMDVGFLIGSCSLSPKNLNLVKNYIIEEFDRLKVEEVSKEELERTKNITIKKFVQSHEDISELNDFISGCHHLGTSKDTQFYIEQYKKVTPEDIKRVSLKYFGHDNFYFIILKKSR